MCVDLIMLDDALNGVVFVILELLFARRALFSVEVELEIPIPLADCLNCVCTKGQY